MSWLAAALAGLATAALVRPSCARLPRFPPSGSPPLLASRVAKGRARWLWALLGAMAGLTLAPPPLAIPAAVLAGGAAWFTAARVESPGRRRHREALQRELPQLVDLYAAALTAGAAPGPALAQVCSALPGAAADELRLVRAGLELGRPPLEVWQDLDLHPTLAPLGRTMVRTQRSGSPVAAAVTMLADDLAAEARASVEDRARAVGVRAAVPLGLCLLPAFLLLGIVPLVVTAAGAISW